MKRIKDWNGKRIVISRTDSIGDVMLTLPLAAWLKNQFPTCHLTFLCKNYTAPIVKQYNSIDAIMVLDELEQLSTEEQIAQITQQHFDAVIHVFPRKTLAKLFKKAKVPIRIGTSHRVFHWLTCNIRPNFTRKKSPLHEAQLNFELLRPFGLTEIPAFQALHAATQHFQQPTIALPEFLPNTKKLVILHPKSQGSAREWPIEKYMLLAKKLVESGYFVVFTGTEKEGMCFRQEIPSDPHIIDSTGKLSIEQLIALIYHAKALVACSTGPLHLAGYAGIRAVGLFAPKIPIHPGRWKPLGINSTTLVYDEQCNFCQLGQPCNCIEKIAVSSVFEKIQSLS